MRCGLRRILAAWGLVLAVLGAAGPAFAQFRGDEIDDRDWDYSSRYFLEVFSFEMPLRWDAWWEGAGNGYRIELGSVLTDEFWVIQEAKLSQKPADWLELRFRFRQAEDFDGRFVRHQVEMRGPVWEPFPDDLSLSITPAVTVEVDPFKEWIDAGARVFVEWGRFYRGHFTLTLVDAVFNIKAKEAEYDETPLFAAHESVFAPLPELRLGFRLEVDEPLRLRFFDDALDETFVFRFRRSRLAFRADAEPRPGWSCHLETGVELAYKKRDRNPPGGPDPESDRFRRDVPFLRFEAERTRTRSDGFEENVLVGFRYQQILETWRHPFAPERDRTLFKRDFALYASAKFRLEKPLYLKLSLHLANLRHDDHFHNDALSGHRRYHHVAAKVGIHIGFFFAPGVEIAPFAYFEPDTAEFGGGGVNAVLVF